MAFIKESVSFLSVPNKSIFKDVIVLNPPSPIFRLRQQALSYIKMEILFQSITTL